MKFAMVRGERQQAKSGASGICPNCEKPMIAKCGEKKIHHWAHKGKLECDPWWESETEWHRNWKAHFPTDWQEVIQYAENGEKHIADVRTDQDWVIEFQHSYLKPEELRCRNEFYKKLIWVIDGKRLQEDENKFASALAVGVKVDGFHRIPLNVSSFIRNWCDDNVPVFFDFGESMTSLKETDLWVIFPKYSGDMVYIKSCPRKDFLEIFQNGTSEKAIKFEQFIKSWPMRIQNYNRQYRQQLEEEFRNKMDLMHADIRARKKYRAKIKVRK